MTGTIRKADKARFSVLLTPPGTRPEISCSLGALAWEAAERNKWLEIGKSVRVLGSPHIFGGLDLSTAVILPASDPAARTKPAPPDVSLDGRTDVLLPGQKLQPGASIKSPKNRCELILQADGNLDLQRLPELTPIWSAKTVGTGAQVLMQEHGNLVVLDKNMKPVWASNTQGHPGACVFVQEDGNLTIGEAGKPIWASHTKR